MYVSRLPAQTLHPVAPLHPPTVGDTLRYGFQGAGTTAIISANRSYYVRLEVPYPRDVISFKFYNNTGSSGNWDLAIYDADWAKLISKGSTAWGAAGVETWTLTNRYALLPGRAYHIGFATDTAKNVAHFMPNGTYFVLSGYAWYQTSTFPLPTTPSLTLKPTGSDPFPYLVVTYDR